MAYGDDDLLGTGGSYNARYMRDPASAIQQRKYALAQALQKQGMDTSAVVGTGNTSMQAIARVLQGGLGGFLSARVEGEAKDESEKMREAEAKRQALIFGLTQDTPPAATAVAPMPDRLGGAPPATDADRAGLAAAPAAPVVPVQREALPPVGGDAPPVMGPQTAALQRQAESGGRMDAKNPLSTATGPDQFIESTWLRYAGANPERFQGMNRDQILARRTDGPESANATQWLAGENRAALSAAGLPTGPGELALGHRFGDAGAVGVLKADPNTPAEQHFSPEIMAANPDLRGKTVGQIVQRYQGRYGGTQTAGAPAPEPTPPGGVAQRTGGTDLAGPGVPQGAAPAPEQPAGPSPADLRRRAAQAMALGGTGAQQAAQVLNQRADAMERQQFQTQNLTEQRRLAAEAAEERRAERNAALGERRADRADTNARQAAQDAESRRRFELTENRRVVELERQERLDAAKAAAPVNATEGERKAAGYLGRMQAEEAFIARMVAPKEEGGEGYKPGNLRDRAAAATPLVGNYLTTEEGQRYLASGAEWVRAKLRHESGAAIGQQEAIEEAKGYFPMPGDSDKAIADKAARRAVAIDGLRLAAGRLAQAPPSEAKPEGAGGAPVKVATPAEAAKLPSGTPILLPDGTTGRVP